MKNHIVMTVDGAKARFFTLEAQDNPEMESGPNLERTKLKKMEIREYSQDIIKLSPREIHAHLAGADLLPERKEPTQSTRFRQ